MFAEHFYDLFLDAAPWLLGGLVIAGLIHSFVATETLARHLGHESPLATLKAAIFGAPLPLCSCSVIPAAISLRRNGASKSATVSFLVSTPETGVDSIAVSYAMLGPFMAVVRPVAAVASAVSAGMLTLLFAKKTQSIPAKKTQHAPEQESANTNAGCCSQTSCCAGSAPEPPAPGLMQRFLAGQRYAFVDIFNDMAGWLLAGLVLAAMTLTWVPADFLSQWGGGFTAMLVMAVVGIPMYICATASTPIAAGLLVSGVSPGAVLVFMLAGPATNMATLGIIRRELGGRALSCYLAGVISVAFLSGYLTNLMASHWQIDIQAQLTASEHLLPEWLMLGSALMLLLLMLNYARIRLRQRAVL